MVNGLHLLFEAAAFIENDKARQQHGAEKSDVFKAEVSKKTRKQVKPLRKPYKRPRKDLSLLIDEHIEDTSIAFSKKFSFKCAFCSEVMKSYGNYDKAYSEMRSHVLQHYMLGHSGTEITKRKPVGLRTSGKRFRNDYQKRRVENSNHTFYSQMTENGAKLFMKEKNVLKLVYSTELPESCSEKQSEMKEPTENEEQTNVQAASDTHLEADNNADFCDSGTLKFGQIEHSYARREDNGKMPPRQRQPFKKLLFSSLSNAIKHVDLSYLWRRTIFTPPFPFVYDPMPPHAAQVVEFHSNGDPVGSNEPLFDQCSARKISAKKPVENKESRKGSKLAQAVDAPRSVLECVDNRVTCKPSASSEQKDAVVPIDNIENSENVVSSMREIAVRNISMLKIQRDRRKYRNGPSGYICELCNKRYTANTSLTYHYMSHLNMKPFKCHKCTSTFTRRHSLNYHLMIHNNMNRFECSTCRRLFRHPSHYKEHLRKHTGEEPYSCNFCLNKFKTRNSYKRHLKIIHQKLLTSNGIVPIQNDS